MEHHNQIIFYVTSSRPFLYIKGLAEILQLGLIVFFSFTATKGDYNFNTMWYAWIFLPNIPINNFRLDNRVQDLSQTTNHGRQIKTFKNK